MRNEEINLAWVNFRIQHSEFRILE